MPNRTYITFFSAVAIVVGTNATASGADYDYYSAPLTHMSGASCLPAATGWEEGPAGEIWTARDIASGFVNNVYPSDSIYTYCPLERRNSSTYGRAVGSGTKDRVLMQSLKISVRDSTSTFPMYCQGFIRTGTQSTYYSERRYACSTAGGCVTPPADSFVGTTALSWTNPFGSSALLNVGATNIGYFCSVPRSSKIAWAEAVYSSNGQ